MTLDDLRERCESEGQGHVFSFWDSLDDAGRERLGGQIAALDFALIAELRGLLGEAGAEPRTPQFEPPELFPIERDARQAREAQEAARQGRELLDQGLVGYVLVAGGQGSRLGFDGPKGKFPIGPVSGCSLFEWHARRLLAARARHAAMPVWYVMTSATNDAETRAFFEGHDHFGLGAENVRFFQQAMLPALDPEGRILLAERDSLFLAPSGHGGSLAALATSGCLDDAERRGIECLSYFQVDNPLARPADPLFLGMHFLEGASMSSKVVPKRDAGEKVGVIGRIDGRLGCIEYSDLPEEQRLATDSRGNLRFRAGNIAVHAIERRFVAELTEGGLRLPWHLAHKQMNVLDEKGERVQREGVKFETFVFDALGHAERSLTLEVERRLEFSPVKNATGEDSPESCRRDLTTLFAGWARSHELPLPPGGSDGCLPIEVDPRFAETHTEFAGRMPASPTESAAGHIYE